MLGCGKARNMQLLGGTCLKENRFGIAVDDCFVAGQDVRANNTVLILAVNARVQRRVFAGRLEQCHRSTAEIHRPRAQTVEITDAISHAI